MCVYCVYVSLVVLVLYVCCIVAMLLLRHGRTAVPNAPSLNQKSNQIKLASYVPYTLYNWSTALIILLLY